MKIVCVLYPDPISGYPPKYVRDDIPHVGLDSCPSDPWAQDHFHPGDLLGCKSGELGLRRWLESQGHTLVVTTDKCVKMDELLAREFSGVACAGVID